MAKLTISTDGVRYAVGTKLTECHDVEDIEHVQHYGMRVAQTVMLTLSTDQALAIAYDLLYQAVDAGKIKGWGVQFPEVDSQSALPAV